MKNQEKKYITNMKKNLKKLKSQTQPKPSVVIDAYYNGINGWTYSYTYPDMETATGVRETKDIYDLDDEQEFEGMSGAYIYIPRHTGEYSIPPQYLKEIGLACESSDEEVA